MPAKKKKAWIEVAPYGLVGGMIAEASTMIFQQKNGDRRFSVWLSDLQSRIAVSQSLKREKPFDWAKKILDAYKIIPLACFFVETKDERDIVAVAFQRGGAGKSGEKIIQLYADEALAFCILSNCRFFCREEFFNEKRKKIPRRFKEQASYKKPFYLN